MNKLVVLYYIMPDIELFIFKFPVINLHECSVLYTTTTVFITILRADK